MTVYMIFKEGKRFRYAPSFNKISIFFKSKGRGDERERQQRDQLQNMERRVALSIRGADTAEAKLELMDGVINKLKASIKILLCFFFERSKLGETINLQYQESCKYH